MQDKIVSIKQFLVQLQNDICQQIEYIEKDCVFDEDKWDRIEGGGGISRILKKGKVFEQAGVNFSHVKGKNLPPSATHDRKNLQDYHFEALGVSVVIHPLNPYIPTTHMNVRFFCAMKEGVEPIWWFGGGFDLTPYYPFDSDIYYWHKVAFDLCSPFGDTVYPRYKKWCDNYFYLPHRQETRGVGGLFFDNLNEWEFESAFAFMQSVGKGFMTAYIPIVNKRKENPYTDRERQFQLYRRGRYVEFNLLYDRGTIFGLQSNGRTESILMSLPPQVRFEYNYQPTGDDEKRLKHYLIAQNWLELLSE